MAINPLERPMFANGQPMPNQPMPMPNQPMPMPLANMGGMNQGADGTGITSGLMPSQSNETEETNAALTQVAQGFEQLNREVDAADDYEGIMNALRGDERSTKERRSELAQHVGEKDAAKTPDSVLTLVQPLFEAMSVAEQGGNQASLGLGQGQGLGLGLGQGQGEGIATLPPLGADIGNNDITETETIVQAPGMEEASMRIAMGETPVNRYQGTDESGENNFQFKMPTDFDMSSVVPSGSYTLLDAPYDKIPGRLPLNLMSPSEVAKYSQEYLKMIDPAISQYEPETFKEQLARTQLALDPYKVKPKTTEQIKSELQHLYGSADKNAVDIQALLALAQYGSDIASSNRSLLGAAAESAGPFAKNLSSIFAAKAKMERDITTSAYGISETDRKGLDAQEFAIIQSVVSDNAQRHDNFNLFKMNLVKDMFDKGYNSEQINNAIINNNGDQMFSAALSINQAPTETWGKLLPNGKWDIVGVRKGADKRCYMMVPGPDGILTEVPVTEGYKPIDSTTLNALSGGVDWKDAKSATLLIPDDDSKLGYSEVPGAYLNGVHYVLEGATYDQNGQIKSAATKAQAPAGYIVGDMQSSLKVSEEGGITKVTFLKGDDPGMTWISNMKVEVPQFWTETEINDGKAPKDTKAGAPKLDANGVQIKIVKDMNFGGPSAYRLRPAKWQLDSDTGRMTLISGTPGVKELMTLNEDGDLVPAAVTSAYSNLSQEKRNRIQSREHALVQAILHAESSIMPFIQNAVGPMASVKRTLLGGVAAFITNKEFAEWMTHEASASQLEGINLYAKELARALSLSERFAVAEQELIRKLAADPEGFFKNPDLGVAKFGELTRFLYNQLEYTRAEKEADGKTPRFIRYMTAMPQGSTNDPYFYDKLGHVQHLQQRAEKLHPDMIRKLKMKIKAKDLEAMDPTGAFKSVWDIKNKDDYVTINWSKDYQF